MKLKWDFTDSLKSYQSTAHSESDKIHISLHETRSDRSDDVRMVTIYASAHFLPVVLLAMRQFCQQCVNLEINDERK
jgi:hypothetical protein